MNKKKRSGEEKNDRLGKTTIYDLWVNNKSLLSFHFLLKHTDALENDSVPIDKVICKSDAKAEPGSHPQRQRQPAWAWPRFSR